MTRFVRIALAPVVAVGLAVGVAVPSARHAQATETRNWRFHTYDYACNAYSWTGALDSGMLIEKHFVYQGWNYETKVGDRWLYAYSWVYPFGQTGPAQITAQWGYSDGFSNRFLRLCPPR